MCTKNMYIHVRANEDTKKKLKELTEYHNRSEGNMLQVLIEMAHKEMTDKRE